MVLLLAGSMASNKLFNFLALSFLMSITGIKIAATGSLGVLNEITHRNIPSIVPDR